MSYKELIEQSIQGVYEKGIAKNILKHMGQIRNASDITQARRWPMELLQNAGDLAYEGRQVSIRVCLERDRLVFEHTGTPFRVRDILSIVNQVSSKNPGETVGQFGTGFITTYQLSEKVEIRSVLKEDGLPYKRFSVVLDRSGKTYEELHEAIEKNMRELSIADEGEELHDYDKDDFNTAFVYHLESSCSKEIALTGMRDLRDTILYIMLFSQSIRSVELEFAEGLLQEERQHFVYERGSSEIVSGGRITETVIMESGKQHILRHISDNGITIAAEYDAQKGYLKLSERTPRLFIDFPLIGAEEFPFPMVINSRRLEPNEPRSGIALVDLEHSEDSRKNKVVMDEAVSLYGAFLKEAVGMGLPGIENVLYIPKYQDNKEWSRSWVESHLYHKIYEHIAEEKIFDTAEGRQSLNCRSLCILQASNTEEQQGMMKICAGIDGVLAPEGEVDWYSALANYSEACGRSISVEGLLKKAGEWSGLDKIKCSRTEWCRKLYELGISNEETAALIRTSAVAILPNQCADDRLLYRVSDLYRDNGIPEVLKDVSEDLDQLKASRGIYGSAANAVEIRKRLLHNDIKAENLTELHEYPLPTLTEYIVQRSRRRFPVESFSYYENTYIKAWRNAWIKLLCCGPDKVLYDICRQIYAEELPNYEKLEDERISSSLWKNAYIGLLEEIFENLEKKGRIDSLKAELDADWLSRLFNASLSYYEAYSLSGRKMFPNQKGQFCALLNLYEDKIEAKELKKIACCFSRREEDCNILEELLYEQIKLDGSWNPRIMTNREVTSRISRAVSRLLSEGNLNDAPEELQDACTLLLAWLQEHPVEAKEYFPEYSTEEEQAKLVTSKAVVNLQKKSRGLDRLIEIAGTEDVDELLEIMEIGVGAVTGKKSAGGYDEASGVFFGNEIGSMPQGEREDMLRKIGRGGELYAMEQVGKLFDERGWSVISKRPGLITLEKDSRAGLATEAAAGKNDGADWIGIADDAYGRAELFQPDTEGYHQEGWDIRVRLWRADEEQPREFYIEVKTHTIDSDVRRILRLSDSQMRLAASSGGKCFAAVMVDYDWKAHAALGMRWFPNILEQISKGRIRSAQGKYWFFVIS